MSSKKSQGKGKPSANLTKRPALHSNGLVTPESTPAPEDKRAQAENESGVQNEGSMFVGPPADNPSLADELERVLSCTDDAEILRVSSEASEEEKTTAWIDLGCLLHPTHSGLEKPKVEEAFNRLKNAAERLGVDSPFISQVELWDGKERFDDENDNSNSDNGDDSQANTSGEMEEDIPLPLPHAVEVYKQATPLLSRLAENPEDIEAEKKLESLNVQIREGNEKHNANLLEGEETASTTQSEINVGAFKAHYRIALQNYDKLQSDPDNEQASKSLSEAKEVLKEYIRKNHLPSEWSVPEAKSTAIVYPWPTLKTANGSLIIGVRRRGRGFQACVEENVDGQLIRRLKSGVDTGREEVRAYMQMEGYKDLSEHQWSKKDRTSFDELLWVTKARGKLENIATPRRSPEAICCGRFGKKIDLITPSSLRIVLGTKEGNDKIEENCKRDGFAPPWDAGYDAAYNDPGKSRSRKRPIRRLIKYEEGEIPSAGDQRGRAESPSGTKGMTSQSGELPDIRIQHLEKQVETMAENMGIMMAMLKQLTEAAKSSP